MEEEVSRVPKAPIPLDGKRAVYCSDPYSQSPLFISIFNRLCFESECIAKACGKKETLVDHVLQASVELDQILNSIYPDFIADRGNVLGRRFQSRSFTSDGFLVYTFKLKMTRVTREVLLGYLDVVLDLVRSKDREDILGPICRNLTNNLCTRALATLRDEKNYEYNFLFGVVASSLDIDLHESLKKTPEEKKIPIEGGIPGSELALSESPSEEKDTEDIQNSNSTREKEEFKEAKLERSEIGATGPISRGITVFGAAKAGMDSGQVSRWLFFLSVEIIKVFCSFLESVNSDLEEQRLFELEEEVERSEEKKGREKQEEEKEDPPYTPSPREAPKETSDSQVIKIPKSQGPRRPRRKVSIELIIPAFFGIHLGRKIVDAVIDDSYYPFIIQEMKDITVFSTGEKTPGCNKGSKYKTGVLKVFHSFFSLIYDVVFVSRPVDEKAKEDITNCLRKAGAMLGNESDEEKEENTNEEPIAPPPSENLVGPVERQDPKDEIPFTAESRLRFEDPSPAGERSCAQ